MGGRYKDMYLTAFTNKGSQICFQERQKNKISNFNSRLFGILLHKFRAFCWISAHFLRFDAFISSNHSHFCIQNNQNSNLNSKDQSIFQHEAKNGAVVCLSAKSSRSRQDVRTKKIWSWSRSFVEFVVLVETRLRPRGNLENTTEQMSHKNDCKSHQPSTFFIFWSLNLYIFRKLTHR